MKYLTPIFNEINTFDWSEAFYKFGFDDGDGVIRTYDVAYLLQKQGYRVRIGNYSIHNHVINSIKKDEHEILPLLDPNIRYGYTHPRYYLPTEIIGLLDKAFPSKNTLSDKFKNENH